MMDYFFLFRALIQTNQPGKVAEKIQSLSSDINRYNKLLVYKLQHESQYEKCLEILKSSELESCEYFQQLGQSHFNLSHYPDALNAFLRATKLEPHNADCFFWLGRTYMQNGDNERARKCLEKSVFLNAQHEQSVIHLSTIYRQNMEWDFNAKLLQNAAQAIPNMPCKWAALLLGFHH